VKGSGQGQRHAVPLRPAAGLGRPLAAQRGQAVNEDVERAELADDVLDHRVSLCGSSNIADADDLGTGLRHASCERLADLGRGRREDDDLPGEIGRAHPLACSSASG
jgi:hypothetical protein